MAGVILETGLNWLAFVVNLGALIGMTTVMLVQLYGQSRICYAMSRDGLFPKFFGHVHEKYRTPFKGTWFFGLLTAFAGGFINITQNAKKICFMGTFSSVKDTDIRLENGRLNIVKDSNVVKFVPEVEQITFSGDYARETGQEVLYITARAVFRLTDQGLTLVEVAPGAELERDIYPLMGFRPAVAADLKEMDPRIFRPEKMGLVLQD